MLRRPDLSSTACPPMSSSPIPPMTPTTSGWRSPAKARSPSSPTTPRDRASIRSMLTSMPSDISSNAASAGSSSSDASPRASRKPQPTTSLSSPSPPPYSGSDNCPHDLGLLVQVAQRAAGPLDVGDAPAGLGLDQVEGDLGAFAEIVESDLAGRLRSVGLHRNGEVLDLPVLGVEEGIAVEPGHFAAPLGLPHVGVDGARQSRHEEAVGLLEGIASEICLQIRIVDRLQERLGR